MLTYNDSQWLYNFSVGKSISTKSPYNEQRMDITGMYKYPEGKKPDVTIFTSFCYSLL